LRPFAVGLSSSSLRTFSFPFHPARALTPLRASALQTKYAERRKWSHLLQAIKLAAERVEKMSGDGEEPPADDSALSPAGASAPRSSKRRRTLQSGMLDAWRALRLNAEAVERQVRRGSDASASAPVFAFVDGALVSALQEGTWLLLDEVNLAPTETLERLASVLEARALPRCALPSVRLRLSLAAVYFNPGSGFHVPLRGTDGAHRSLCWSPLTACDF
jgi:hypothetical protein